MVMLYVMLYYMMKKNLRIRRFAHLMISCLSFVVVNMMVTGGLHVR
jgi:hypothetical protein